MYEGPAVYLSVRVWYPFSIKRSGIMPILRGGSVAVRYHTYRLAANRPFDG